jgi:hypothetical protein
MLSDLLDLASQFCHGEGERYFCYRCTGVWAGAALALPLVFFANRRIPGWLWILGIALFLQMPVLGYGEVPLPDRVKMISGQAFALVCILALSLNPARKWRRPNERSMTWPFLITSGAGIGVLQGLGGADYLCLIGLCASLLLWLLTMVSLFVKPRVA